VTFGSQSQVTIDKGLCEIHVVMKSNDLTAGTPQDNGERLTSAVVPLLGKTCLYPSRTSNEEHQATTKPQRIAAQRDAQLCVERERTAIANTPVRKYIGDLLYNKHSA
jgi:hypothetical protein